MEPPNNQKKLGRKKTQNRIQFMHGTYHEQYKEHTWHPVSSSNNHVQNDGSVGCPNAQNEPGQTETRTNCAGGHPSGRPYQFVHSGVNQKEKGNGKRRESNQCSKDRMSKEQLKTRILARRRVERLWTEPRQLGLPEVRRKNWSNDHATRNRLNRRYHMNSVNP